ncbi:unnamed protein product, partial [Rotaria sp. Silwood2]
MHTVIDTLWDSHINDGPRNVQCTEYSLYKEQISTETDNSCDDYIEQM